jgi:hypothetical protein
VVAFNKRIGSSGDVGFWHETYLVKAGEYETIYNAMPPHGLGKFTRLIPAKGRYGNAASRIGKVETDDSPMTPEGEFKV